LFHEKKLFFHSSNNWGGETIKTKSILLTNCKSAEFAMCQQRQGREAARLSVAKNRITDEQEQKFKRIHGSATARKAARLAVAKLKNMQNIPAEQTFQNLVCLAASRIVGSLY